MQEEPQSQDQPEETSVGRPLKFATAAELDVAIQTYFDECDPHVETRLADGGMNQKGETIWKQREVLTEQKPYTMSGLARALGVDRKTLLNYKNRDEFFPSIKYALAKCEEFAEGMLFSPYSNGAKFNLTNNYGDWHDKQEIDHTSKGKSIQPKIVSDIAPRHVAAETETASDDTADKQPAD